MKKALYAIILCAIIAGSNGVLIKHMNSLSAGAIGFFRTMIPVLILSPVLFSKSRPLFTGNYKKMLLASAVNVVRLYFYLLAFIYTSIGNAIVLAYTWPIFVFLIETRYYRKPLNKQQILLLLLAFTGMVITYTNKSFSFGNDDLIGMVSAVLCAIGYAITVVMFKSESENYTSEQLIVYQNLISSVFFLPFMFFLPEVQWDQIGIGLFYGVWVGIVIFKLFFYGLKFLPASTASGLMYIEIVSAITLGYFVLHETLNINTLIGGTLILISSFLITRANTKKG
ncbi:threonine/homoserine efflux transporter RhtA [Flavobacteriaceae bacterium MAR_2009_75]|nr:threonine/homoserine efflux transporter RhtA [Flavobacteriaceae bacterium MAR_2009_75]